jgi:hypothetical protein
VGSHGEVLWDFEQETEIHRRKSAEHEVCGLVATPDGRALWADGSPHGWVIDPDHPSGYMKLPMRRTSVDAVESEGIVALGLSSEGRCILAARDGAVAWTNRALRLETERFLAGSSRCLPLAVAGDDRWIYVLRPGAVVHRFLIAQPEPEPGTKQEPEPLPEAQTVRLSRPATCLALVHDHLVLGGPQADDQLGRLWRERTEDLQWEPLRLGQRVLVEPVPPAPDTTPKKPDFTPTKSKLQGPPISAIRVDDVLAGSPEFWITRGQGLLLERPIAVASPDEVLPGDALLLPAMLRLHEGTSRPGLVLWPGVADEQRAVPPLLWLTWGDQDRGWLPLQTPAIRRQGWSRREVFPLQVALAHPPPQVLGRRPKLPDRWNDQELFAALAKECKKLLKVLW